MEETEEFTPNGTPTTHHLPAPLLLLVDVGRPLSQ